MAALYRIVKDIINLFKENDFFVPLSLTNPEDYIGHNNINAVTIDTTGIKLYHEPSEYTLDELDKQLKEYIIASVPDAKNVVIKIERSFDLTQKIEED